MTSVSPAMPPRPLKKGSYPFTTRFRRNPPPLVLSLLLLAGVIFAGFRFTSGDVASYNAESTSLYLAQNELLRLDEEEGFDTFVAELFGEKASLESVAEFLGDVHAEGILSGDGLWYKAVIELEAGQLNEARKTAAGLSPGNDPFARCLLSLLNGQPVSPDDRGKLWDSMKFEDYTWWMSRVFRRLDLAESLPEWEAALREQGQQIRTNRIAASIFSCALLLLSLAGLPFLWKRMRRGVPGVPLPGPAGLPSMARVVIGAWAVAEALRLLAGEVAGPEIMEWLGILVAKEFTEMTAWMVEWAFYAVFALSVVFLPAWLTGRLGYGRWRLAMRYGGASLRDFKQWPVFLAGAGCLIPVFLIDWVLERGLSLTEIPYGWMDIFSRFQPGGGWYELAFDIAFACIAAPLFEELVFRGFLLETVKRHTGFWAAAVLSSGLFAVTHYYSPGGFISVFLFGMAMACVMQRTGKLSICMLAHGLFNLELTLTQYAS